MLLTHLIRNKYKKNISTSSLELYTGKSVIHSDKSVFLGIEGEGSLALVDLLMGIPGVSEAKAAAVVK